LELEASPKKPPPYQGTGVRSGELVVPKVWGEEAVRWVFVCTGGRGHGIRSRGTERGDERIIQVIFGGFFGAAKNKKRNRVHRKRVARIKHRRAGPE
jgi:hypothetical protein